MNLDLIKLTITRVPKDQRVAEMRKILTALKDNPDFPALGPALDAAEALCVRADTEVGKGSVMDAKRKQQTEIENAAIDAVVDACKQLGHTCEGVPGVTPAKLLGGGWQLRGTHAPVGDMGQVTGLVLRAGGIEGQVKGASDGMHGAASFEEEVCLDIAAGVWVHALTQKTSSFTLTGQPSGRRISVRQRAIGTNGPGPWSEPMSKMVP